MDVLIRIPDRPFPVSSLRFDPPLSDAELEDFCRRNDVYRIERTREGLIKVVTPTGLETGGGNANVNGQLYAWWNGHRQGQICDSNAGYYLPDGSMLSPDASYLTAETLARVPKPKRKGIPHICPDFVIELISETDTLTGSKRKMERWIANGVHLGWLLEPKKERVWVYRNEGSPTLIASADYVEGSGPVVGFRLDLEQVWDQYR